jgi:HEAT repeat protein
MLNAPAHKDLFLEIIAQSEDTVLQAYAARMAGFAQDSTLVPSLVHLLRRADDAFVAEQAAEALARLDARQMVRDIEQALEEFAETERASGFITALAHFREPSSTRVLIDALERNRSLHVHHEVIEALGAFLTDRRARQIVLERLETWRGGNMDMGEQCPAIRALARHDPQFLLQRVCQLYDAGRLDRSARQELALWIPHLTQAVGADGAALLEFLRRLVCDRYLPVRERVGQSLGRVELALCHQVYEELCNTPDEWCQACAVYSLGFWNSDEGEIQSARYADAFLIRHAADAALEMRHRRHALQRLVKQYGAADGVARLAAYLSIKEHGDEQAIWALRETVHEDDLARTFLRQLIDDVTKQLEEDRRKRGDEEQKLLDSVGAIRFD